MNFSALRKRIFETQISAANGNHSARLWRVIENIRDQVSKNPSDDRLLHLMSRLGVLCRGLGEDLRAGQISNEEAATILELIADLGDLSYGQWLGTD